MPDEGFLSMNLYARFLGQALRLSGPAGLEITEYSVTMPGRLPKPLRRLAGRYVRYPWRMQRAKSSVNHVTDHSYGFLTYFLPRRSCVVTCHDLAPLHA